MYMSNRKAFASFVGMLGAAVLLAGCSSGQQPVSLGTSSGGAASGGSSASISGTGTSGGTATPGGASASGSGASSGAAAGAGNKTGSPSPTPAPVVATSIVANSAGNITVISATPSDPNAAAVLATFMQYRTVVTDMADKTQYEQALNSVADGSAATLANNAVTQLRDGGNAYGGPIISKPSVSAVDMTSKPLPTATVTECFDQSKWIIIFASGPRKGQSADAMIHTRPYPITAKLHKSADGHWRVTAISGKVEQQC